MEAKKVTVTMAAMVHAKIDDIYEKDQWTNKSALVEELIRLGIPEYEKIKALENGGKRQ